jgi:hypothetical protein
MLSERDGGPAYTGFHKESRVSVRDYFAAHALAAIAPLLRQATDEPVRTYRARIATEVYAIADAMLAERSKR